jgi:polyferredoxin
LDLGDCIDCGACVRTCPTGIDIRDGLQMECVNCTQCIDACNDVMRSIDKPEGLIRFTSEGALEEEGANMFRPGVLIYGALLAVCLGVFGYMLANLPSVEATARLASSNEYRMIDSEQAVANQVSITVRNRKNADQSFEVSVTSPEGASFRGQGAMKVSAGEFERTTGWVMSPRASFSDAGRASATVDIKQGTETITSTTVNLLGPRRHQAGGSSDNPSP